MEPEVKDNEPKMRINPELVFETRLTDGMFWLINTHQLFLVFLLLPYPSTGRRKPFLKL